MPAVPAYSEQLAQDVLKVYEDGELKLMAAIRSNLQKGIAAPNWMETKLSQIREYERQVKQIIAEMERESADAVKGAYAEAYKKGGLQAVADMAKRGKAAPDVAPLVNLNAVQALQQATITQLNATSIRTLSVMASKYQNIITQANQQVLLGTATRQSAAQQLLTQFAQQGVTGFTDRSGRGWNLHSYAEMTTRTGTANAFRQGTMDMFVKNDFDLVVVSTAPNCCPICQDFEGDVLSLSGSSTEYPSMDEAVGDGLFHCNCRHGIDLWQEGYTAPVEPAQTPEENAAGYKASQDQRYFERQIRQAKREKAVSMDEVTARKAQDQLNNYRGKIRDLLDEHPELNRKRWRESYGVSKDDLEKLLHPDIVPPPVLPPVPEVININKLWNVEQERLAKLLDDAEKTPPSDQVKDAVREFIRSNENLTSMGKKFDTAFMDAKFKGPALSHLTEAERAQVKDLFKAGYVPAAPKLGEVTQVVRSMRAMLEFNEKLAGTPMVLPDVQELLDSPAFKSFMSDTERATILQPYEEAAKKAKRVEEDLSVRADSLEGMANLKARMQHPLTTPAGREQMMQAHMDRLIAENGGDDFQANTFIDNIHFVQKPNSYVSETRLKKITKDFGNANRTGNSPINEGRFTNAVNWLGEKVNPDEISVKGLKSIESHKPGFRADCNSGKRTIRIGRLDTGDTFVHEFGHHLQDHNVAYKKVVRAFFTRRTKGEELEAIYPGTQYADEMGYRDKFLNHYTGKVYDDGNKVGREVNSMGLQLMYTDPAMLYREDPEMFNLILSFMMGAY